MDFPGFFVLFIIIVVAGVVLFRFAGRIRTGTDYPYVRRKTVFSKSERSFLRVLDQVQQGRFRVMGKVSLADLIQAAPSVSKREHRSAMHRICRKHVHFVLLTPQTLAPVCAIELVDKKEGTSRGKGVDRVVENALNAAGIPLVRFALKSSYSPEEIASRLSELLDLTAWETLPAAQNCPECGEAMTKRKATGGRYAGRTFWVCRKQGCRTFIPLSRE